jgi:uncharacterized membrane protein
VVSQNRSLMIVLSYLWLFIIPLILEEEKRDPEVQWHAKHGLVVFVAEIIVLTGIFILGMIPVLGCFIWMLYPVAGVAFLILNLLCIVKGINGERFKIPGLSEYAERF